MALNGALLGQAIKLAIDAKVAEVAALPTPRPVTRDETFEAMGNAIVTYITSNAVVAVVSVSGVTTGPGVSGPGTGTIA